MKQPLALLALLALGCGPETIADLSRPALVLVVGEGGGFCSSVYAVDADGAVWSESGCETRSSGFRRESRTVDAAERGELDALMDEALALPADGDCMVVSPSGRRFRFVRTLPSGEQAESEQCEPGVPAPARELADRMEALARPPIPDSGPDA